MRQGNLTVCGGRELLPPVYHQLLHDGEGLFALIRKNTRFGWVAQQETAFQDLLKYLANAPILRFPDLLKGILLETYASNVSLGEALTQEVEDTRLPIAYASRTLKKDDRKYSTIDKVGLWVYWAVRHFMLYILGMLFTIVTDHASLRALRTKEKLEGRLQRWAKFLSKFDYDIIYQKGTENVLSDLL